MKVDLTWQHLKFEPGEQVEIPVPKNTNGFIYTIEHDLLVRKFPAADLLYTEEGHIPIIQFGCTDKTYEIAGQKVCDRIQVFKNTLLEAVGSGPGIRKYVLIREDFHCYNIPVTNEVAVFGDFGFAIYSRKRRRRSHEGIPQHPALPDGA